MLRWSACGQDASDTERNGGQQLMYRITTRRGFLGLVGAVGAALAGLKVGGKRTFGQTAGERYEDFVILPYGAPVPDGVSPTGAFPALEGGSGVAAQYFETPAQLRQAVDGPLYSLPLMPSSLRPGPAYLIRNNEGRVAVTSVAYQSFVESVGEWVTTVEIMSSQAYLWPIPVWPSLIDDVLIPPVKVHGLPGPAVMITTAPGYLVQWVERGRLLQLRVENGQTREYASSMLKSLRAV